MADLTLKDTITISGKVIAATTPRILWGSFGTDWDTDESYWTGIDMSATETWNNTNIPWGPYNIIWESTP